MSLAQRVHAAIGFAILAACCAAPGRAVNVVLDYSYDATNFFGAGNPSGAAAGNQARAAIEAAAAFYSSLLGDALSAVAKPPDFYAAPPNNGVAFWDWSINFPHPSTGVNVQVSNPTLAADEYRIYVGARNIAGSTLGIGGPGGVGWSYGSNGGFFSASEIGQLSQLNQQWSALVENRGQSSGFVSWGGAVTFDRDGSTVWHYNHTTAPATGTNDFYSVAIHEMAHALGFGASDAWNSLATGALFAGNAAAAAYGSPPPLEPPNAQGRRGHWASGTMSRVFGTSTPQEAALDPDLTQGTRKVVTALDAAALVDIGWSVSEPPPPTYHPADFNQDRAVNGADLNRWKNWYGPSGMADANGDGVSDGRDLLAWQRAVGFVQFAPASGGAPEPAGAALAAWCAAMLARRRRMPPFLATTDKGRVGRRE